jgi:L-asparaginase/Glu-tRNA(Gln) amidotransferase subunit D
MVMPRATLTQSELTRYLKAYRDAGIPVVRSEISRDGKVVIYSTEKQTDEVKNPWDRP